MQSGQDKTPSTPLAQSSLTPPDRSHLDAALSRNDTAEDLMGFLKEASTPKFLKGNNEVTNQYSGENNPAPIIPQVTPAPIIPQVTPAPVIEVPPPAPVDDKVPDEPDYPLEVPKADEKVDVVDDSDKTSVAKSLVDLRKNLTDTRKSLKTSEEDKKKLEEKVQKYETGAEYPEVLKAKEAEIQRLSVWEKLHNLKGSEEYRAKFIEPLHSHSERLKAIAKDYEIPEEVIVKATQITNRAELNRFLVNHFDDVGALEVKQIIGDIQTLSVEAQAAEREPEKAIAAIREETQKIREAQEGERRNKIVSKSRTGWIRALTAIQTEGKAQELIIKEGNTEHNEKVAKVVLNAASTEYAKIVRILGEHGISDLPEDLSYALARMSMLAHASAVAIDTRDRAVKELETLTKNTKRDALHVRPAIGSSGVSTGERQQPPKTQNANDAAESILKKIGVI